MKDDRKALLFDHYRNSPYYKQTVSGEHQGKCPHCGGDDRFHVKPDGLFGCRQCNAGTENTEAAGIIFQRLQPKTPKRKKEPDHKHVYTTEDGTTVFTVIRFDATPTSKKRIFPILPNGRKGLPAKYKGPDATPRPIYNLLEVALNDNIIVVEGEIVADTLNKYLPTGTVAISWCGGTGAIHLTDWSPLKDKKVLCISDADTTGRKAMVWLSKHIEDIVEFFEGIYLPGETGKDVKDILEENNNNWEKTLNKLLEPPADPQTPYGETRAERHLRFEELHKNRLREATKKINTNPDNAEAIANAIALTTGRSMRKQNLDDNNGGPHRKTAQACAQDIAAIAGLDTTDNLLERIGYGYETSSTKHKNTQPQPQQTIRPGTYKGDGRETLSSIEARYEQTKVGAKQIISQDELGLAIALGELGIHMRLNDRSQLAEYRIKQRWIPTADDEPKMRHIIARQFQFQKPNGKGKTKKTRAWWTNTAWPVVRDAFLYEHTVDPFLYWLENDLPEWDGIPRIDTLLIERLGAEDTFFSRLAAQVIILGTIMRTYQPGAKLDETPLLVGPPNIGKSKLLSNLLPPETRNIWFTDSLRLNDPIQKQLESLERAVLVEVSEMQGGKDIEKLKAFLTRVYDKGRKAYGRSAKIHARRVVFVSTSNFACIPADPSGALRRRFIGVTCTQAPGAIEPYMDEHREQIWAEGLHRYNNDERPSLPYEKFMELMNTNKKTRNHRRLHARTNEDTLERHSQDQKPRRSIHHGNSRPIQVHRHQIEPRRTSYKTLMGRHPPHQ